MTLVYHPFKTEQLHFFNEPTILPGSKESRMEQCSYIRAIILTPNKEIRGAYLWHDGLWYDYACFDKPTTQGYYYPKREAELALARVQPEIVRHPRYLATEQQPDIFRALARGT